jgi:Arc/MetJ-type ribon-helix-helix transcriptional regulator
MMNYHTDAAGSSMKTAKVAITLDQSLLKQVDRLVEQQIFPNRSKAIQAAIQEKLDRLSRNRLARECAKLDPKIEQAMAEEDMEIALETWSKY